MTVVNVHEAKTQLSRLLAHEVDALPQAPMSGSGAGLRLKNLRTPRRVAALAGAIALALAGALSVNTARQGSLQPHVGPAPGPAWPGAPPGAVERLSRALGFPTVSEPGDNPDPAPFRGLHAFIRQAYPAVHAQLEVERVSGTRTTSDPAATRAPARPAR